MKIQITSSLGSTKDLLEELKAHETSTSGFTLDYETGSSRYRGDPLLIALVGLAGTGLGSLISGICNIAAQKGGAYVEISGKDWSVKVPVSMPAEERNRLIEQAKSKDIERIQIHS